MKSVKINVNDVLKHNSITVEIKIIGLRSFRMRLFIVGIFMKIIAFVLKPIKTKATIKKEYRYKIQGQEIIEKDMGK